MTESETEETAAEITAEEVEESSDTTSEPTSKKSGFSHTVGHKDGGTITIKNYSIFKAVKLKCSDCCGFESDPRECIDKLCPLWPFRGYTIANRTRAKYAAPTPERVQKMRDALAKSRAAKNGDTTQSNI